MEKTSFLSVNVQSKPSELKYKDKVVVEEKDGKFKLDIIYYAPYLDDGDNANFDEMHGKNDFITLYDTHGNILQKVDGQEIIDCITSKYGEALYEIDIQGFAFAEFLMAYYNVDKIKLYEHDFEYDREKIEGNSGKIRFQFDEVQPQEEAQNNSHEDIKQNIISEPIEIVCSGGGQTGIEQFDSCEEVAEKIMKEYIKQDLINRDEVKQSITQTLSKGHTLNTDNGFVFMRKDAFFDLFDGNDTQHDQKCNCPECSKIKNDIPEDTVVFSANKEK